MIIKYLQIMAFERIVISTIIIQIFVIFILAETQHETRIGCEHKYLKLECNDGESLQTVNASYGRTSVSICGLGGDTNCHAEGSFNIVKKACDGMQVCNIYVSSRIFGDPCPNTIKYLEVSYICKSEPKKCENNELVCHDGSCIQNSKVCNGIIDCTTGEDENSCNKN